MLGEDSAGLTEVEELRLLSDDLLAAWSAAILGLLALGSTSMTPSGEGVLLALPSFFKEPSIPSFRGLGLQASKSIVFG